MPVSENGGASSDTADWRPELSAEEEMLVNSLAAKLRDRTIFTQQLRQALGLSELEFLELLRKDEFEGLPAHVPRQHLTIVKLQEFVEERGGTLQLVINLGGRTINIPG